MKDKRGSVTVISLVFLLFLFILGGSWLVMMTQEKANAMGDQKQQQAWYAAEAGYRRAINQIKNQNTDWRWLTSQTDYNSKSYKFWQLSDLKAKSSSTDQTIGPWFAVYISNISNPGTGISISTNTAYNITAIGEYMGERKVINRTYTLSTSDGSDKFTDNTQVTTVDGALVVAKGDVSILGSGKSDSTGTVYTDSTYKGTSNKGVNKGGGYSTSALNLKSLTLPDEVFTSNKYKSQVTTADLLAGYVASSGLYILNGASGGSLYIKGGGNLPLLLTIYGPTDDSADPFTIVSDGDLTINGYLKGNIRIFTKGTLTLTNSANVENGSKLMLVSNTGLVVDRSIMYGLLITPGDVSYYKSVSKPQDSYFYGQILAGGSVTMHVGYTEYSNVVASSTGFTMPVSTTTSGS